MANENMIKFLRGNVANLPQTATEGALYFTKDEGIYLGMADGSYHRYGDFITVADVNALPTTGAHATCMYYCTAENILARYDSVKGWIQINKQPTAEEMKTLLGLGSAAYTDASAYDAAGAADAVRTYVGDIPNDENGDPIATSVVAYINKKTDGIATSGNLEALGVRVTTAEGEIDALQEASAKHVEKVDGKSLVADTEITKLAGVSEGANKVENVGGGKIKIDGEEVTVYAHPEKHAIADVDGLQTALDGLQAAGDYAAEEHTHTKDEITDFAHTHVTSEIADLDDTIKGYDYATKTEAQGYAENQVKSLKDNEIADINARFEGMGENEDGTPLSVADYVFIVDQDIRFTLSEEIAASGTAYYSKEAEKAAEATKATTDAEGNEFTTYYASNSMVYGEIAASQSAMYDDYTAADADTLAAAKQYTDDADKFEIDMLTVNAHGGVAAGTDLNGLTTHEILKKILYPYVEPTLGNATASPNGGTYEKGVTKTITSVSIAITKKSEIITSVALYNGSTLIEEKTGDAVKNGGTITFSNVNVEVPTNGNQLTVKVTDAANKTYEKKTSSMTFVYPYYMGSCAAGTAIDETLVESLTKKVESKGNKSNSFTVSDGHMVFAYPKAHGVLKSVLDPNNFETIGNYTRSEVSVTGLDGTAQTYYVYVSGATTVSGFTVNFKY